MPLKKLLIALFWIAAIAMPVAASLIAIAQFPPNVEIPMHWNAQGEIDRYGTPWEMLPISLIMTGCNALLALSYALEPKERDGVFGLEAVGDPFTPSLRAATFGPPGRFVACCDNRDNGVKPFCRLG